MTPHEIAKMFFEDQERQICLAALIERYATEQVNAAIMIRNVADAIKCKMGCGK